MRYLVIGNQRHKVDTVETLHPGQSFEARLAAQIVVGNDNDVGDELTRDESLTDLLQQRLLVRSVQAVLRLGTSRWQERETHAQRQMKLRLDVLGWGYRTLRIEKFDQTG